MRTCLFGLGLFSTIYISDDRCRVSGGCHDTDEFLPHASDLDDRCRVPGGCRDTDESASLSSRSHLGLSKSGSALFNEASADVV